MNKMEPLVSIVTPCYNGALYLDRYFQSILEQTYPHLELIFINDGSSDNTEDVFLHWKSRLEKKQIRVRYLFQENTGQAAALNKGIKLVEGGFMVWPDADDEMTPDSIEKRVRFLQTHPEYDFCAGAVECRRNGREVSEIYRRKTYDSRREALRHMIFDEVMMSGSFMIRTSFLDRILAGREIYAGRGGQNPQILLPAIWYGKIGQIKEVIYIYHIHEDSHSHDQNNSLKVICQLQNYEDICVETIKRMNDPEAWEIIPEIQKCYARRRFGTAVDTRDAELIRKYYRELAAVDTVTIHDRLLKLKYVNPLARAIFHI